jgi:hypothetical protein
METSIELPHKTKHRTTVRSSYTNTWYIPKRIKVSIQQIPVYPCLLGHYSQYLCMESVKVLMNRKLVKKCDIYTQYNIIQS